MNDKTRGTKGWDLICQTCFHRLTDHPKNIEGKRPCSKEMQFIGMSVFCYCTKFNSNTKPLKTVIEISS